MPAAASMKQASGSTISHDQITQVPDQINAMLSPIIPRPVVITRRTFLLQFYSAFSLSCCISYITQYSLVNSLSSMCTYRSYGAGSSNASTRILLASFAGRVITFSLSDMSSSAFSFVPYFRFIHKLTRFMYYVMSFRVTAQNQRLSNPSTFFQILERFSSNCPTTGM